MKTKQELCSAAGLPEATFNTWLGRGLLPEPLGVSKRRVLWDDDASAQIIFIQEQRAAGKGLDEIKDSLPTFRAKQAQQAKEQVEYWRAWKKPETAKPMIEALFGFQVKAGADVFLEHSGDPERHLAYVTALHGDKTTFARVDITQRGNERVVFSKTVPLAEFVAFVQDSVKTAADNGRIFSSHGIAMDAIAAFEGGYWGLITKNYL